MRNMKKTVLQCVAFLGIVATSGTAFAECNATINGRPMTYQECSLAIQVYGTVIPGRYGADANGNWWNLDNPLHQGNTYRDAQRNSRQSYGGSFGGGSLSSPHGVYDGSGGCEGGSCVNIID